MAPLRPAGAFLAGDRLYLRPLRETDVDGAYADWLNDERVCAGNSHHVYPYTRRQAQEYVGQASARRDELVLAIVVKEHQRHIGNIALSRIDSVYRSAEFAILLGDAAEWGKGYGLEAGRLLVAHGFRALNLHRIGCGTFATNVGMQRLALALGMKQEGVRRSAAYKDGAYVDVIEYGLLRDEFLSGATGVDS